MSEDIKYSVKIQTGNIRFKGGWQEGYAKLDGFLVPAPKYEIDNEKIYDSFEEMDKDTDQERVVT